ncbi:hypothetical protein H7F51_05500 [Novosphingobium flavum]|uniref:Uncharacterized protein n=1 Tax=Novosphingobium flavum TaxID=1778672 RepID=A0A7X1KKY2_9SPHN|nr:hypothetical protein [Novosphingobium flavum]MBC2664962.1 hypothetical protein [Novosphingobium flavum]
MSLSSQGHSRPDRWLEPRQPLDPVMRRLTYGRIQPMDEVRGPSVWSRLFHWA